MKKKKKFKIDLILSNNLCSGCGACVGVCPVEALEIDIYDSHQPKLNLDICIECGLCYEVCPGKGYPVYDISKKSVDKRTCMHPQYGPVRNYWIGHSTDADIRLESASGGVATGLMLYLLEKKIVEAVAVVKMKDGYPVPVITDDPEEVMAAKASKYSPVPMMMLIRELKDNPRKIAMTLTPCQLAAFKMASEKIDKLKECLVISIGLFCGQVKDYESVSSIAASLNINYPDSAKFLGWRCGPYPGSARFKLSNGYLKEKPLYPWLDIAVTNYALNRCFLCPDGGNWLADMTLGDIHSGGDDETVIVCRTAIAEEMLLSAEKAGFIELKDMSMQQVESCVINGITGSKLKPALTRIEWREKKGKFVPQYDYKIEEILKDTPNSLKFIFIIKYILSLLVRKGWLGNFLKKHPYLMEKVGHFIYKFPSTLPGWSCFIKFRRTIKNKRL
jgi:coenzyme F420 hydrogenase subunit beta